MKLEKQACSREPAQKLVELGVTVPSYFSHAMLGRTGPFIIDSIAIPKSKLTLIAPAWTVAELGEMLSIVEGPDIQDALSVLIAHQGLLSHADVKDALISMLRNPDLCAKVLIWLIDNGRVMVEELNNAAC